MITVIILAGGRSLRLGRCKAMEPITGESLIVRIIRGVAPLGSQVIVAVARDTRELRIPPRLGVKTVRDILPGSGPLVGIHSGLTEASSSHCLVVACDMPFLNQPLLQYTVGLAPDFDVVIPRIEGRLEPLHAVYSKTCLPYMEKLLEEGHHSVYDLMPYVKVRYVEKEEVNCFDPEHLSFFNLNTQTDLNKARFLMRQAS